jgi:zona occludens toxin
MITLITGAPRSGKTLYTVDKLFPPEIGRIITIDDGKGDPRPVTRRLLTNINQLQLVHELVDNAWLEELHKNVQPADFICFDEVQRVWPNRPAGAKKPPAVEYLETHGHDAVDLVIMTQSPMLLDPSVRALIGRHFHVRKIGGLGVAIIYEWDGCSNSLNFRNAFRKKPYWYSSKAQALYKSAKGHTGSKASLPFVALVVPAAIAGSLYYWPHLYGRITGQADPTKRAAAAAEDKAASASLSALYAAKNPPPQQPPLVPPLSPPAASPEPFSVGQDLKPVFSGCAVARTRCVCYDTAGTPVDPPAGACERVGGLLQEPLGITEPELGPRPSNDHQADLAMIRATTKREPLPLVY